MREMKLPFPAHFASLRSRTVLNCLLAAMLVCSSASLFAAPAKSATRWEYRIVSAKLNQRVLEQMLNAQAAQGWELLQITDRGFAIFKKPAR